MGKLHLGAKNVGVSLLYLDIIVYASPGVKLARKPLELME